MASSKITFRIEIVLAGLSILAFIATMMWPNWFELVFGADPDGGDGSLERVVALSLTGATALVMILLAVRNLSSRQAAGTTP